MKRLALLAIVTIFLAGCGSSGKQSNAAPEVTTSTTSGAAKQSTRTTTPGTVKGELRGTATDFCSAVTEGSVRLSNSKGKQITSAAIIINEWIADLRRFAPANLQAQAAGVAAQLTEISKQIQLGGIATNQDFANRMGAALGTPDGKAVGDYATANCPHTATTAP